MKLSIDKCGEFYEIFDWDSKTTLFVSKSKNQCIKESKDIYRLGINDWLAGQKVPK